MPEVLKSALIQQAELSAEDLKKLLDEINNGGNSAPVIWNGKANGEPGNGLCFTLVGDHENRVTYSTNVLICAYGFDPGATRDAGKLFLENKSKTLANGTCPGHHNGVVIKVLKGQEERYIVRRLMPIECARLQGFPPDWCADVPHSDSAEYKLWGNGIALPSLDFLHNAVRIMKERKEGKEDEQAGL